ncbi:hypothetical protein EQP59_10000 [Ornithobacterium rhinotracheale]|uniref:Uncharacterized protein n=1 Tax=Ornithobacterium rhinotracheale TaxID=28251 RepID=A0A3R5Y4P2_ORNRH|nr:hypothetical protein EQP59_10000 [Ornithobacterium rhinotracheale]
MKVDILNDTSEHLSFIRATLYPQNSRPIRIDIMQNIRLYHPIEEKAGVRLINDLDIGSLKLLSFANRGTKKDLYDLYFLSQKYGLTRSALSNEVNF